MPTTSTRKTATRSKKKPAKKATKKTAAKKTAAKKATTKTAAKKATTKTAAKTKPSKNAPIFTPALLRFLGELALNNERDWFNANKQRYEDDVREPARALIRAMGPKLARLAPSLVASDKKVGGSLMRIYRDTRFGADKTPYKTNVGIQFRHRAGKDVHAPGLYIHVEPGEVFLGAGLWRPDKEPLAALRKAIADDPKTWRRVRDGKKFTTDWSLSGESLKRPPRGFDRDHPEIEDIKRKDFIAICPLPVSDLFEADLPDRLMARFRSAKPFFAYLVKVLDLTL